MTRQTIRELTRDYCENTKCSRCLISDLCDINEENTMAAIDRLVEEEYYMPSVYDLD